MKYYNFDDSLKCDKYNVVLAKRSYGVIAHFSLYIIANAYKNLTRDAFSFFTSKYFDSDFNIHGKYIDYLYNYNGSVKDLCNEIQHEFDMTGNISIFESEVQ